MELFQINFLDSKMQNYGIIINWVDASFTDKEGIYREYIYPIYACDVLAKSESLAIFCVCEMRVFEEFEIEPKEPLFVSDIIQEMDIQDREGSLIWQRTWN